MANDYQGKTISGTSRRRANAVYLANPNTGVPSATFAEEELITFDGGQTLTNSLGQFCEVFDPADTFPLLDENDQPTGQVMTQAEFLLAVKSLYLHRALLRDAREGVAK